MDSSSACWGTGAVYAQDHQHVELPATDSAGPFYAFVTPKGHYGCKQPLTVSEVTGGKFTVYNYNSYGVEFNWMVVCA